MTIDLESGRTLYPYLCPGAELRFIRKVYGIVIVQFLLTAVTVLHAPLNAFLSENPGITIPFTILLFVLHSPLRHYQQKRPLNFVFLGLFTVCLSLCIAVICATSEGRLVLEALILTSGVVLSLTGYTFWATKKGKDFSFLGLVLFAGLIVLILTSFLQMFFPLGSTISVAIVGGLEAFLFSAYLVYDTDNLIKRITYDKDIWASVVLYLDILNLFLSIMKSSCRMLAINIYPYIVLYIVSSCIRLTW